MGKVSFINNALKYGLIISIFNIVLTLVYYVLDVEMFSFSFIALNLTLGLAIIIGAFLIGVKSYRTNGLDGKITFGQAFMQGLTIGVIGYGIIAIFTYIFHSFIAPDYMAAQMDGFIIFMEGMGVPDEILTKNPQGVLIRDDYHSYKHLDMPQQSCWTHLLRVSREMKSKESQKLHRELKRIFKQLDKIIHSEFNEKIRKKEYEKYNKRIEKIIKRKYNQKDTKQIQTRIKNQNINLITALQYSNVSLTNNHAEQQIRPLTVQRKISGGSRSNNGAQTQAVNFSIIQTLKLRGGSLSKGLQRLLTMSNTKYAVEIKS